MLDQQVACGSGGRISGEWDSDCEERKDPVSFLSKIDACSDGVFDTRNLCDDRQFVQNAVGCVCVSDRRLVSDGKPGGNPAGGAVDLQFACIGLLPVCPVIEYTDAGDPLCAGKAALSGIFDRTDASDLSLYFYFDGYRICNSDFTELQAGI